MKKSSLLKKRKIIDNIPYILNPFYYRCLQFIFWKLYIKKVIYISIITFFVSLASYILFPYYQLDRLLITIPASIIAISLYVIYKSIFDSTLIDRISSIFEYSLYGLDLKNLDTKYFIVVKNKLFSYVNPILCKKQNINDNELENIKKITIQILEILDDMKIYDSSYYIKQSAKQIEELEFQLQEAWHFPKDKTYHRFTWQIPQCKCPIIDNLEKLGTDHIIINETCPAHGELK